MLGATQPRSGGEFLSSSRLARVRPPHSPGVRSLFVLTCLSTFSRSVLRPISSAAEIPTTLSRSSSGMTRDELPAASRNGLMYSGCLMLILGAHELGHYLQARRYRVPASLPFFIPLPISPIGTMGAVIVQQSGVADRKSMFDIAISGPLAGLVFALPITYWGIAHAQCECDSDHGELAHNGFWRAAAAEMDGPPGTWAASGRI